MTALVYEVLWTRMITNVIGGAPFAVATVLTIFMGGIGAGSYLAGRIVDRQQSASALVRLYGWLEIVIAVFAFVVPLAVFVLKPVFGWIYQRLFDHFLLYNLLVFAGCFATLAIPALCMGATLPVLCRYQIRELRKAGRSAGLLYGLNTAGAALGALLGGVWLVPQLGVWWTLTVAAAASAVIGLVALGLAKRIESSVPGQATPRPPAEVTTPVATAERREGFIIGGALLLFGMSGFCSMSYEVLWTKLLALIVGPTNYSFTLILVTFILALAVGSLVFGRLGDRVERPERLLVATQLAAALLALGISQLLGESQLFFAKLTAACGDRFALQHFLKAMALLLFLGLPTVCLGAAFPLVGRICSRQLASVGRAIGMAYAVNSAGSVLGSFVAGFLLIPFLGKEKGLALVISLQLIAALAGAALMRERMPLRVQWRAAGVALAVVGLVGAQFLPRWNHLVLASSKYHRLEDFGAVLQSTSWLEALLNGPRILLRYEPQELLFYGEGIGGFTTVTRTVNAFGVPEYHMANSGKFDASSLGDMNTQVLLAHVPLSLHPAPRSALVIGLASGVTAGEVLQYPVEQLDILEINEQAARASDYFLPWNHRVLADPRTRLIIQDARAHLCLSHNRYDVIISEPSNPWMAGCAALFTRDFFRQVKSRLNDNGCFALWLHAYQIDWASVALIGRSFVDVFPASALISTHPTQVGSDYLLVGFNGENALAAEAAFKNAGAARKSPNLVLKDPRLLQRLVVTDHCAETFGIGPLNTDNRPLLEFNAPRQMHRSRDNASEVIGSLLRHRSLPPSMKASADSLAGSSEGQIDFAEFALSLFEPFAGMFEPTRATDSQTARFARLLENYCESNEVDVAMIPSGPLCASCVLRQLELLQTHGKAATNESALLYRADLHKAAGQKEPALQYYRRCAELNPLNVRALNEAGILLCEGGQLREGMEYFHRVLRIEPKQAEAQVNLATAYYNSGNPVLAEFHFKEALRINPSLQEAIEGIRILQRRQRR